MYTLYDSIAASAVQMQAIAGQQYDASGAGSQGGIISSAFTNMRTVAAFSVQHKVRVYIDNYTMLYAGYIFVYYNILEQCMLLIHTLTYTYRFIYRYLPTTPPLPVQCATCVYPRAI